MKEHASKTEMYTHKKGKDLSPKQNSPSASLERKVTPFFPFSLFLFIVRLQISLRFVHLLLPLFCINFARCPPSSKILDADAEKGEKNTSKGRLGEKWGANVVPFLRLPRRGLEDLALLFLVFLFFFTVRYFRFAIFRTSLFSLCVCVCL